jgi:hypothetical protein
MTAILNSQYAQRVPGGILAVYIPANRWTVHVRWCEAGWKVEADPSGHDAARFTIAVGADRSEVESVARRWADCATTAVMQYGRIRYVGVEAPARVLVVAS